MRALSVVLLVSHINLVGVIGVNVDTDIDLTRDLATTVVEMRVSVQEHLRRDEDIEGGIDATGQSPMINL
jgi:hypothetical protein